MPLVFEAGGRPVDETVAFVRSGGGVLVGAEPTERSQIILFAWQQCSSALQSPVTTTLRETINQHLLDWSIEKSVYGN